MRHPLPLHVLKDGLRKGMQPEVPGPGRLHGSFPHCAEGVAVDEDREVLPVHLLIGRRIFQ